MADADVLKRRVDRLEAALAKAEEDVADLRRELAEGRRELGLPDGIHRVLRAQAEAGDLAPGLGHKPF